MRSITTWILALAMTGLTGCTFGKKTKKIGGEVGPEKISVEGGTLIEAEPREVFVEKLREGVRTRNLELLASMMLPNFGYSLNPLKEGDGVFQYWDENRLWDEIELVVNDEFVEFGKFYVSPPAFAEHPESYRGFRTGIILVNGHWKWAYLVGN